MNPFKEKDRKAPKQRRSIRDFSKMHIRDTTSKGAAHSASPRWVADPSLQPHYALPSLHAPASQLPSPRSTHFPQRSPPGHPTMQEQAGHPAITTQQQQLPTESESLNSPGRRTPPPSPKSENKGPGTFREKGPGTFREKGPGTFRDISKSSIREQVAEMSGRREKQVEPSGQLQLDVREMTRDNNLCNLTHRITLHDEGIDPQLLETAQVINAAGVMVEVCYDPKLVRSCVITRPAGSPMGMSVYPDNSIAFIDEGTSVALEGSLQVGDVILSINGLNVVGKSIQDHIPQEGTTLSLEYLHWSLLQQTISNVTPAVSPRKDEAATKMQAMQKGRQVRRVIQQQQHPHSPLQASKKSAVRFEATPDSSPRPPQAHNPRPLKMSDPFLDMTSMGEFAAPGELSSMGVPTSPRF